MNNFKKEFDKKISDKDKIYMNVCDKKEVSYMRKGLIAAGTILFLGLGTVSAAGIINKFKTDDKGIQNAEGNGYYQEVDLKQKYDGLEVSINKIIMDDKTLGINLVYKTDKDNNFCDAKLLDVSIFDKDLVIKDEKGNNLVDIASAIHNGQKTCDKGVVNQSFLLESENNNFPKSEKLNISFKDVKFEDTPKLLNSFNGKWNFNINLDKSMSNRSNIKYIASHKEGVKIIDSFATNTGMFIKMGIDSKYKSLVERGEDLVIIDENGKEYNSKDWFSKVEKNGKNEVTLSFQNTKSVNGDVKLKFKKDNTIVNLKKES